jgi:hypothetical protein
MSNAGKKKGITTTVQAIFMGKINGRDSFFDKKPAPLCCGYILPKVVAVEFSMANFVLVF